MQLQTWMSSNGLMNPFTIQSVDFLAENATFQVVLKTNEVGLI